MKIYVSVKFFIYNFWIFLEIHLGAYKDLKIMFLDCLFKSERYVVNFEWSQICPLVSAWSYHEI